MTAEQKRSLKDKVTDELKKFALIVLYSWLVLSLFDIHKLAILRAQHLESALHFKLGMNLLNAIVLGKVVLLGDSLHFAKRFKNRALIYSAIFKSASFAVLLVCFEIAEDVLIGMFHGRTVAQSIPQMGGGGLEGKGLVAVMFFVSLIPLFTSTEIRRALGEAEFHSLMFSDRSKAGASQPSDRSAAAANRRN
jgi:hypothetical protein